MKYSKLVLIVLVVLVFSTISAANNNSIIYEDYSESPDIFSQLKPHNSFSQTLDNIDSIFSAKLDNYSSLGYFPQIYESSLQATYYALHVLNAIEKLDEINQTKIVNYVMSHYNISSHVFMDKYAYRYLDTDISKVYYPLSSVLEVNCYAILSLSMLGRLDLINAQDFIDFIWSCYNPATSGFIGQPYDSSLPDYFKTSTMDNTYFAIITLDLLMNNWVGHSTERNALVQYINGLQSTSGFQGAFGGFSNDEDSMFNTLEMNEPNLLSSYYCVKSLEIFDMIDTIRISDFHQYLGILYDSDNNFFIVNYESSEDNFINIVATAIGLELSDLTGFTGINRGAVVDFILNNRNSWGTWDGSTDIHYHELIDTFQVLRSFKDAGEIYRLGPNDRTQIATAIQHYYHYNGYSLLSRDYTSQKLLYSIVNAFNLYDRISDLDLQDIYSNVENSYYYNSYLNCQGFVAHANVEEKRLGFRSRPIEYYASGHHDYITEIDTMVNHKSTFMALDTLKKTFKLDDFDVGHDLEGFLGDIINSQFLEQEYDNYGAFLPFLTFTLGSPEYQDKKIFFEYSYYAIKALELLVDYLELPNINNITDLDFDKNALYSYIFRNIVETPTTIHFNPQYTDDIDISLQNTFFAIHVLKALDLYNLNDQKIKNFVEQNINYQSVKNVYYSYKISESLGFIVDFDLDLSQELFLNTFSESLNEYYLNTDKDLIDQSIFSWACEIIKNDNIKITADYDSYTSLGSSNHFIVYLDNLIVNSFDSNFMVKFESAQLGSTILEKNSFDSYEAFISVPNIETNIPKIDGFLKVYDVSQMVAESPVSFATIKESQHESGESASSSESPNSENDPANNDTADFNFLGQAAIPLSMFLIALPGCAISYTFVKSKKLEGPK